MKAILIAFALVGNVQAGTLEHCAQLSSAAQQVAEFKLGAASEAEAHRFLIEQRMPADVRADMLLALHRIYRDPALATASPPAVRDAYYSACMEVE